MSPSTTFLGGVGVLAVATILSLGQVALAQPYPSQPIKLVNGFPPGGGPDTLARQLADALTKRLGVSVIVDNRAGATGTIGAAAVARAAPDGYTLLFGVAANLVVGPATLKNVPYDPVGSFTPVIEIARGPYVLLASTKLAVRSVPDLIEEARRRPGKLNYGSVGPGSPHQYAAELLKKLADIDIVHVPYRGGGPAYIGFHAGDIQLMFDSMPGPEAALQAGTVRPLAVTGNRRIGALPDVPTFSEVGLAGMDISFMFGVMAPANTPQPIITKLNAAITDALRDPDIRATLARQAVEPSPGSPEEFGALVAREFKRWTEIVEQTGFRPE